MIKGAHRDSTHIPPRCEDDSPHDVLSYFFVCSGFWDVKKLNDTDGETFRCPLHDDDHAISLFHVLEGLFSWLETFSRSFPLIFFQAEYAAIFLSPFFVNVQLARRKIVAPQGEQECFPLEGSFQWQCFVNRLFLMCRAPGACDRVEIENA